jgi:hypothetical protein
MVGNHVKHSPHNYIAVCWEVKDMYYIILSGGLSLAVEGPSKAEISCHDNKDGTVSVSYLPTAPGEYKISVKFGDKHIKGSPYNAKITGTFNILGL